MRVPNQVSELTIKPAFIITKTRTNAPAFMQNSYNDLITSPISKLIWRLAIPASTGLFFNTMYNVVDTFFAGQISTTALAAMSLTLPVYFVIISIGSGVSTGTSALIGNALGAGQIQDARMFGLQGITFSVLLSLFLSITGISVSPFLFRILGADDRYLALCMIYMTILLGGCIFMMLIYTFNAILSAQGDTRSMRNVLIIGFFLNLGLDPLFVFGVYGIEGIGFPGIALSTIIIHFTGSLYMLFRVVQTGLLREYSLGEILPQKQFILSIMAHGLPAGLNMATIAIGVFVITYFIGQFGKEAVAAYGAAMRVEQMVLIPCFGLNTATLTLIAQNSGANLMDRMQKTYVYAVGYGLAMTIAGGVLVYFAGGMFMEYFTKSANVIEIGKLYLKIDALVLSAYILLFLSVAAMQGMKKPMFAVYMGLYRQIIAPFLVFYLVTKVWNFGVTGIFWSIFAITWTGALFALWYTGKRLKLSAAWFFEQKRQNT